MLILLAALAVAPLSLQSCPFCATEGRVVRLCEPHSTEERSALARERKRLDSKDPAARIAALEALAALTESHRNAPSERVAVRIASALGDEDFAVRSRAARLLGRPQHALTCLDALVEALGRTVQEHDSANAEYEKLGSKLRGKLSDKRRADLVADRKTCDELRRALGRWRLELVERLANFLDDRAVDAILAHTHRNLLTGGDVALLRLGNQKAVRALAESFEGCDRNLEIVAREAADWQARAPGLMTAGLALALKVQEDLKALSVSVRQDLVTLLVERGLKPPDVGASSAVWRTWIDQNIQAFPEHLPGLSAPAW